MEKMLISNVILNDELGILLTELIHTHHHKPLFLFLVIVGLKCYLISLKDK